MTRPIVGLQYSSPVRFQQHLSTNNHLEPASAGTIIIPIPGAYLNAMNHEMTDDDIGKTVVNANGESIGMVTAVQHGTAHIEPDPGMTDSIKSKLGWGDTNEDTYPLQESSIERVTDDEIRLQSNLGDDDSGQTQGL